MMDSLNGAGETGSLIRAYDWSSTSLGAIEFWPQILRTTVDLLLRSPVPIVTLWGHEGIVLYNDAFCVFAGGRHPKLLGAKVREGWPEVTDFTDNVMRVVLAGGTLTYKDRQLTLYRHGRAEQVSTDLNYSPVVDESGAPAGVICVMADTTQRRVGDRPAELLRAEEALRQAHKMAAVGQLTGGIAHDFNNLLVGITGSLELLQRRVIEGRSDGLERLASMAMASAQRAAALTQRLLAFARRQPLDPKRMDVNRLLAGMEDLLRRSLGPRVALDMELGASLWPTLCDANQFENAILNLAINGCDAMPEGGRLSIETVNSHLDEDYICVCVTDTGSGMSADILAKAFDPFFTTKPVGRGTGLGLSMLQGFVEQFAGRVDIQSEPGKGTTVRLHLPRLLEI